MRRPRRMVLDPERKFFDTRGAANITQAGFAVPMNHIDRGTDRTQRIGMQCLMTGCTVRYTLTINNTNLDVTSVKVALVHWRQPMGTAFQINSYWEGVTTVGATTGQRVLTTALLYRTLWSKIHRLDVSKQSVEVLQNKTIRFKSRFIATGGTFNDQFTGGLYLLFISNKDDVGDQPAVEFSTRVRFVG